MTRTRRRSLTIEEVLARFDQWRQRRRGRSPIPDELWAAAGELARRSWRLTPPGSYERAFHERGSRTPQIAYLSVDRC
jgi:hypothetical protein